MLDPILTACGAFLILIGIAITRVGLYGEHLGRFRLVSYVRKHAEQPRRRHRYITAGMGIVSVLLGLTFLVIQFAFLHPRSR
jgi:hypothetical protein